jgi:Phosphotransferase enzyme family
VEAGSPEALAAESFAGTVQRRRIVRPLVEVISKVMQRRIRMPDDAGDLSGVDAATLAPMVRDLLGEPEAGVTAGWSCRPLGGGSGGGIGLYRVTGPARVGGTTHLWALVCKVYAATDGADPEAWDYPAREGLAYGSGLLAALPGGLAAPRCLAVEAQPDGTTRLWLEAIADAHPGPWLLDRYVLVARDLGRFNGAYVAGVPLPDQPWLSRGLVRSWVEPAGPAVADLERHAGPSGPSLVRRLFPPAVVAQARGLWDERERFLTALDRLPQTFCHHDAFRRNLLHRAGPEGEELVAVDWAFAGHGAVGEELVPLVVGSLAFFEAEGIRPRDLDAACFASYVAGLREAGWVGDERVVRLGFAAHAALRYPIGHLGDILPLLSDPALRLSTEELLGRPLEEVVEGWAELWSFQFGLAEEARALLLAVG